MTERHPAFNILHDMEIEVTDVGRWAELIRDLGTGGEVSANGLFAVGIAMVGLAERLNAKWEAACEATRECSRCA